MTILVRWPANLCPRAITMQLINQTRSLNQSLSGMQQVRASVAQRWRLTLEFGILSPDAIRSYRALAAALQGRTNIIDVPVWDDRLGLDAAARRFVDGRVVLGVAGDNYLQLDGVGSSAIARRFQPGMYIGVRQGLTRDVYMITHIVDNRLYVQPQVRRSYSGDAPTGSFTAQPRLRCRLASDDMGGVPLDLGYKSRNPSLDFFEVFGGVDNDTIGVSVESAATTQTGDDDVATIPRTEIQDMIDASISHDVPALINSRIDSRTPAIVQSKLNSLQNLELRSPVNQNSHIDLTSDGRTENYDWRVIANRGNDFLELMADSIETSRVIGFNKDGTIYTKKYGDDLGLVSNLSGSGYQKLPGGLILQWGRTNTATPPNNVRATFPIVFPNACFQVVTGNNAGSWSSQTNLAFTKSGMTSFIEQSNPAGSHVPGYITYLAIGH